MRKIQQVNRIKRESVLDAESGCCQALTRTQTSIQILSTSNEQESMFLQDRGAAESEIQHNETLVNRVTLPVIAATRRLGIAWSLFNILSFSAFGL